MTIFDSLFVSSSIRHLKSQIRASHYIIDFQFKENEELYLKLEEQKEKIKLMECEISKLKDQNSRALDLITALKKKNCHIHSHDRMRDKFGRFI